jgi:hypothetical protein
MANFHIAYDEKDSRLGRYFEECKEDLVRFIQDELSSYSIDELPSRLCNQAYLSLRYKLDNPNNFLFVAYSHGTDTALIAGGHPFIEEGANSNLFSKSLFYSTACLIANRLGEDLISNGSLGFVGNSRSVDAFNDERRTLSIQADNLGMKMFVMGKPLGEAVRLMKSHYSERIMHFLKLGDFDTAGTFIDCRESLVLYGNPDLTIADFSF